MRASLCTVPIVLAAYVAAFSCIQESPTSGSPYTVTPRAMWFATDSKDDFELVISRDLATDQAKLSAFISSIVVIDSNNTILSHEASEPTPIPSNPSTFRVVVDFDESGLSAEAHWIAVRVSPLPNGVDCITGIPKAPFCESIHTIAPAIRLLQVTACDSGDATVRFNTRPEESTIDAVQLDLGTTPCTRIGLNSDSDGLGVQFSCPVGTGLPRAPVRLKIASSLTSAAPGFAPFLTRAGADSVDVVLSSDFLIAEDTCRTYVGTWVE